ncbi:MAG: hypothetical protein IJU50_04700 [Lachnospiraceae bacterium]|nr:hypothetical protein [Lachnospiraceae bacterium]
MAKRKSVVTAYTGISAFSPRQTEAMHHLIGGSMRRLADEDGLTIPLTNDEHNMGTPTERIHGNPAAEKLSKMAGPLAWEKEYYKKLCGEEEDPARNAFMARYGKSFL